MKLLLFFFSTVFGADHPLMDRSHTALYSERYKEVCSLEVLKRLNFLANSFFAMEVIESQIEHSAPSRDLTMPHINNLEQLFLNIKLQFLEECDFPLFSSIVQKAHFLSFEKTHNILKLWNYLNRPQERKVFFLERVFKNIEHLNDDSTAWILEKTNNAHPWDRYNIQNIVFNSLYSLDIPRKEADKIIAILCGHPVGFCPDFLLFFNLVLTKLSFITPEKMGWIVRVVKELNARDNKVLAEALVENFDNLNEERCVAIDLCLAEVEDPKLKEKILCRSLYVLPLFYREVMELFKELLQKIPNSSDHDKFNCIMELLSGAQLQYLRTNYAYISECLEMTPQTTLWRTEALKYLLTWMDEGSWKQKNQNVFQSEAISRIDYWLHVIRGSSMESQVNTLRSALNNVHKFLRKSFPFNNNMIFLITQWINESSVLPDEKAFSIRVFLHLIWRAEREQYYEVVKIFFARRWIPFPIAYSKIHAVALATKGGSY